VNGHIILPVTALRAGDNRVALDFNAGDVTPQKRPTPPARNECAGYTIFVCRNSRPRPRVSFPDFPALSARISKHDWTQRRSHVPGGLGDAAPTAMSGSHTSEPGRPRALQFAATEPTKTDLDLRCSLSPPGKFNVGKPAGAQWPSVTISDVLHRRDPTRAQRYCARQSARADSSTLACGTGDSVMERYLPASPNPNFGKFRLPRWLPALPSFGGSPNIRATRFLLHTRNRQSGPASTPTKTRRRTRIRRGDAPASSPTRPRTWCVSVTWASPMQ
jgi:hypothetical protein